MSGPSGPGLRQTPDARPELRQSLRAGLRQGMAFLELPALELHAELRRQAETNPFLVLDRPRAPSPGVGVGGGLGARDLSVQHVVARTSLADHLHPQIACMSLSPRVRALALFLASDLDARGLLPDPDPDIARALGVCAEDVVEARAAVQACDPPGVGARDLRDAIALQLMDRGTPPPIARGAVNRLKAFAEERWGHLAAALGLSAQAVRDLAREIRLCSPEPAARFTTPEARPLVPELAIDPVEGGELRVRLIDDPAKIARFDTGLSAQIGRADRPHADNRLEVHQAAARRLVTSLQFRSKTLLRVGLALAQAQSAFFLGHARMPVPLARATLAHELGLHPATVGRAVKGRGVLFGGRVEPMTWFFPSSLPRGDFLASQPEVMALVRDIVAGETADTVLNDDAIAHRLRKDGVDIARRTVAKYRKCLRIPSSPKRRRILMRKAGIDGNVDGSVDTD